MTMTEHKYKLTLTEGGGGNGTVLGAPESPLDWEDLTAQVRALLIKRGFTSDDPDTWCLVTPAEEDTELPYGPDAWV
jgi:hypothetical protein